MAKADVDLLARAEQWIAQLNANGTKVVAWCQEGPIGDDHHRHSLCIVPQPFSWEEDEEKHECLTDVIATTEDNARQTAELISGVFQLAQKQEEEVRTLRAQHEAQRKLVDILSDGARRDTALLAALRAQVTKYQRLVADLQAHAREHNWQDVDGPIAALLALPSVPTEPSDG